MNSPSSQAQAVACSERSTCSDGAQSDTSNGTPTAKRSSMRAFKTAFCTMRQSSGTFESLSPADAPQRIAEWLTLLPQDSHANRSVSPENAKVRTTNETCGPQRSSASAWYDRDTRCWKTCQDSLLLDTSEPSSAILPKAGMTADGACYPQPKWERRISAIDCGLWPTPDTMNHLDGTKLRNEYVGTKHAISLHHAVHLWPTPMTLNRALPDAAAMWPTPKASNAGSRPNANGGKILEEEVRIAEGLRTRGEKRYPTPTVDDSKQVTRDSGQFQSLTRIVRTLENLGPSQENSKTTGSLDPGFVEYLMGWPIGWTDLKPLETDRFRLWLQQHGVYSQGICK